MRDSARSFWVENFGCRATQADGAALQADLMGRGLRGAEERSEADLVVVNTCTVTAQADSDARQTIRRIHRENPGTQILVTGCYAQRRPSDLEGLPGVRWVVGNSHKTRIGEIAAPQPDPGPRQLVRISGAGSLPYHGAIPSTDVFVSDIYEQRELLTAPVLDAGRDRSRPNVKVQDGCNNRCSFCIIPAVRGFSRSADAAYVVRQIRELEGRYPEIVLTGINLGRWGRDLDGRPRFAELLRRILGETAVCKLRISSVEPMDWTEDLLGLAASEPRIAKHVHVPLQSGCDRTLRAMRRRYRARHYADRVERARALMPEAGIGADVMVGFPGESTADFEESRAFIERMPFTYLHVFTFSAREGTAAAEMSGLVPKAVKKERNRVLRELAAAKNAAFRASLVGRTLPAVTLEPAPDGRTDAMTDNFLKVSIRRPAGSAIQAATLVRVRLEDSRTASLASPR